MYKIELANGTILDNLELNGNNFIPDGELDKDVFKGNLDTIIVTDDEGNVTEYKDMKVVFTRIGSQETFVLSEKTRADKDREKLEQTIADLDYLSIMSGVNINV